MKFTCMNCGKEEKITELKHDDINLEGFHAVCSECGASSDIDFDFSKTFITDVAKMADFKKLTKERFLESYDYLTEEEYDATELYYNWLMADEN